MESEEWRLASFDVIHVVNTGHPYVVDNRRHEGGDVNNIRRHPENVFEIPRHGIVPPRTELEMIYNYCQDTIQSAPDPSLTNSQSQRHEIPSKMLLPPRLPPPSLPRAKVYRLFLQHLRFLPDPQVWITTVPKFRKLLETPGPSPSGSNPADNDGTRKVNEIRKWRREKAMKKAHKVR